MSSTKPTLNPTKKSHWHQGKFVPKNPQKYIGNSTNIVYRSKWEKLFLQWLDTNPRVIRYASEECIIMYLSPIDNKTHRYYMDFYMEYKLQNDTIEKCLIEIKPYSQTMMPKPSKKKGLNEQYEERMRTYIVNQAKWDAARNLCREKGWKFMIITEKELFKTVRTKQK